MREEINFEVFGQNVLIIAPEINETTESGIIKSESQVNEEKKDLDQYLEVAGVGPDVRSDLYVGDKVILSMGPANLYEIDGKSYIITHELTILGKKLTD